MCLGDKRITHLLQTTETLRAQEELLCCLQGRADVELPNVCPAEGPAVASRSPQSSLPSPCVRMYYIWLLSHVNLYPVYWMRPGERTVGVTFLPPAHVHIGFPGATLQ